MSEVRVVVDFPALPRREFHQPGAVLVARQISQVRRVVADAERHARDGRWVLGFLTYEAAPAFDAPMRTHESSGLPLAWFAVFDDAHAAPEVPHTTPVSVEWRATTSHQQFVNAVAQIREAIASGRTYQVNLTTQLRSVFAHDPLALYETLRAAQGNGYHGCIVTDEFAVVSASPELFFRTEARDILTRPMKGTRPRGRYTEEDERFARELLDSEKDRAENLMIVDLLRNDLGRIAETGSVRVRSLYDVERYRTVHQMTSTITATMRDDVALADVFAALFPCGSVTGAPKISAMRFIRELESVPRGVYCGALGVIAPAGDATFNVPIRTAVIDRRKARASYGTGAGITYDSDAEAEFQELAAKAAVLVEAWPEFELLETMRIENDRCLRLERHLARLLDSARYFDFAVDERRMRALLSSLQSREPKRVRLLVSRAGNARAELLPLPESSPLSVALAASAVSSRERFLFHKTTNRQVYQARERAGYDDVLLWNERGEVTEFTRGNVVVDLDGKLLTPARDCGLLAGVFRAELLDRGEIREAVIRVSQLADARRIWMINSVREWVSVRFENALARTGAQL